MSALHDFKEMALEQVEYRELLYQMTLRDLLIRYKQTVMGFGWAVFVPLLNTAMFSVIFTRVARIDTPVPYPIFAFCGLLIWNFFASSLRFSVTSLTGNGTLVQKVYFPREIFPLSAVLVSLVDLLIGSLVLVILMIYFQTPPTVALLFVPVVVLVTLMFTVAVAMFLAMGNLFYRDVKYLFEVGITLWMFTTAVLYPLDSIGGTLGFILSLNPMTQIVEAYRAVLLYGRLPDLTAFGMTAAFSAVLMALSWRAFHRSEFAFAENI